ncbi:MAG: hypothetical protein HQ518_22965, partial [Rhodopirellula sp.]|nr:hypothetical protein [Rhodopirellula sp.]
MVNFTVAGTADDTTDFSIATAGNVTYDAGTNTGTVTIPTGMTTATIPIVVLDGDTTVEATEAVNITLTGINNGDALLSAGTTDSIDITDNDTATATFTSTSVSGAESGNRTFDVTLDNPVDQSLTLDVTFSDGTATGGGADYTSTAQTITFIAGMTTATGSVTVPITADNIVEADETFTVNLAVNGDQGDRSIVTNATGSTATGTITNTDTASVTIDDITLDEGTGGTTTAFTFTVTLDQAVQGGFSLAYTTNNGTANAGSDYVDNDGGLTFAGTMGETETITVLVNHDSTVEADETFTVLLGAISGLGAGIASGDITIQGTGGDGVITNDDIDLAIAADQVSKNEGNSGNTAYTFTVTRTGATNGVTTANFAVTGTGSNPADADDFGGAFPSGVVTFNATETTKTITINVNGDSTVELNEDFLVTLSGASDDAGNSVDIASATASTTITNDDAATVNIVNNGDGAETDSPTAGQFRATLSAASSTATTVTYTVGGTAVADSDYTALSGTVVIPAGDLFAPIDVTVLGDDIVEDDETVDVTLTAVTVANPGITLGATTMASVTITDDDTATITIGNASVTEGGNLTFTVSTDKLIDEAVTINVNFADVSTEGVADFANAMQQITLPASTMTQSVSVSTVDDMLVEGTESLTATISLGAAVTGARGVTVSSTAGTGTINDNDTAVFSFDQATSSVNEGPLPNPNNVNVAVTLLVTANGMAGTGTLEGNLSIDVSDAGGSTATRGAGADFTSPTNPVTLTFSASGTQNAVFTINDDAIKEPNETINLSLTSPTSPATVDAGNASHVITILDDDTPQISVAATVDTVDENGTPNLQYTFTRTGDQTDPITVNFEVTGTTDANTDFTVSGAASFNAGTGQGTIVIGAGQPTAVLTIDPTGDSIVEDNETVQVTVLADTMLPPNNTYNIGAMSSDTGTITDDDSATLSISAPTITETDADQTVTFTVTLDKAVEGGFSVAISAADIS